MIRHPDNNNKKKVPYPKPDTLGHLFVSTSGHCLRCGLTREEAKNRICNPKLSIE